MSNILDGIILFTLFGIMIIGLVIGVQVFVDITEDSTLVSEQYKTDGLRFFEAMDNMGIFLVLAIVAVTIGSAFLIKTNPIFFVVAILLLFTQFLVLPIIVNTFNSIASNGAFSDGAEMFPKTIWLMGLSPVLSFIGGGIAAVVGLHGRATS